ncbi:hypothetical protein AJ80_03528 [Polytolypa hystricis UAMH7299]|uniref:Uncharacterized protein n=1 Tax=Polytolypa hystricis (strain UAMH7299) TaxID=1447883 RepID=A0A2B7YJG2_POLH7|nr:hypothetical protein AJ80_03528 [Polytolypa hystricis UAMH7299]
MDSMRSLNTSLPASSPYPNRTQPPEQLLQAFKTAALSVTNLYKNAVSDQAQSRHLGYQEALEDLRVFLDKERIGHEDGEASKIRSWVMERIDGSATATCDSDDERGDSDKRSRSLSPTAVRKESPETNQTNQQPSSTAPSQPETTSQSHPNTGVESSTFSRPTTTFTFTAGPQFPPAPQHDMDMQTNDGNQGPTVIQADSHAPLSSSLASPSLRVEMLPRSSRTPNRHNSTNRHTGRSSTRDSSAATGSKRKFHLPDFFDISNFGNGRDTFGGGKRGRFM